MLSGFNAPIRIYGDAFRNIMGPGRFLTKLHGLTHLVERLPNFDIQTLSQNILQFVSSSFLLIA